MHASRLTLGALLALATPASAAPHGLTIDDMLAMERVGDPVVSPSGADIVYTVRETDLAANKGHTHLWLRDAAVEGNGFQLTSGTANDTAHGKR